MNSLSSGSLVSFSRQELLEQVSKASTTTRLASPFLSETVASKIRIAAESSSASELRLLTAATPRSVAFGALSVPGLRQLLDAGFEIRSIPNLHAKVSLVDDDWGIVGSGNLTMAGLGRESGIRGNIELGVRLTPGQINVAAKLFDGWWDLAVGGEVTSQSLAAFDEIEVVSPVIPKSAKAIGKPIYPPPEASQKPPSGERSYWIKAMYGTGRTTDQWWLKQTWIHDHHQLRSGGMSSRPHYAVGDYIALYVTQDDGPGKIPAVLEVTGTAYDGRAEVEAAFGKEDADRFGWVTPIEVIRATPSMKDAPGLDVLQQTAQGLQNGRARVKAPALFAELEALIPPLI